MNEGKIRCQQQPVCRSKSRATVDKFDIDRAIAPPGNR